MGGRLGYEMAAFVFGDNYFLCVYMVLLRSLFLCDLCHFSLLMVFYFGPLEIGYRATRVLFLVGRIFWWSEFILDTFNLDKVNRRFKYNNLKVFLGFCLFIKLLVL